MSVTDRITSLCKDFSTNAPLPTLLSNFTPKATAIEHGLPTIAPFLGREFTGTDGLTLYFTLVSDLLTIEKMEFEPRERWVVDVDEDKGTGRVCLRGEAKFVWKETGKAWEEWFVYWLDVERGRGVEGVNGGEGEWRIARYEVWADSGAIVLAQGNSGELEG